MSKYSSKLLLAASALAVACAFTLPARAADDKEAKKAERQKKMLEKYDKNKNGKLDPEEEAEMKADQAKAKEKKEKEKAGK
jgi:uncharacterized protein involved in copper resistance